MPSRCRRTRGRSRPCRAARAARLIALEPWLVPVCAALVLAAGPEPTGLAGGRCSECCHRWRGWSRLAGSWRATPFDLPLLLLAIGALLGGWASLSRDGALIRLTGLLAAFVLFAAAREHAGAERALRRLVVGLLIAAVVEQRCCCWCWSGRSCCWIMSAARGARRGGGSLAPGRLVRGSGLAAPAVPVPSVGRGRAGGCRAGAGVRHARRVTAAGWSALLTLLDDPAVPGAAGGGGQSRGDAGGRPDPRRDGDGLATTPAAAGARWPGCWCVLFLAFGPVDRGLSLKTLAQRFWFWENSLYLAREVPLTGAGLGLESVQLVYRAYFLPAYPPFSHAHNIYLQGLLEYGIFGLLGLLGLGVATLYVGWRAPAAPDRWTMAGRLAGFGIAIAMLTTGLSEIVHADSTLGGVLALAALGLLAATADRASALRSASGQPTADSWSALAGCGWRSPCGCRPGRHAHC